jgi:hypothetical protein
MPDVLPATGPSGVLLLAEADYRYGVGPITARVREVIDRVAYYNEPWLRVIAEVAEGTRDGRGRWVERRLYVREAAFANIRPGPRTTAECATLADGRQVPQV